MQTRPRIGELLSEMVDLSGHDVDEILHEQQATQRRFGEIALAWGLCQPEHVWSAWCRQVGDGRDVQRIDLDRSGIDAQAVALLDGNVAKAFRVIPIRANGHEVMLASEAMLSERVKEELNVLLKRNVKFVIAARRQIDAAIDAYYSA